MPVKAEPGPSLGLTSGGAPVFQAGYGPGALGAPYQRQGQQPGQGDWGRDFLQANAKQLEEAESADVNAGIHGNWTMETAKSFLHQFIQTRHIRTDYTYSMAGRSFVAEMRFYVKELRREIAGREAASNKQSASKSCALSLVRQLFHLGVIEAFSGTLKKNKDIEDMKPYEVTVSPELVGQLEACLGVLELKPVLVSGGQEEPLSLLSSTSLDHLLPPSTALEAGIVPWSPPTANWNPWQGVNIDEGPLARASMDAISQDLARDWGERCKGEEGLQKRQRERQDLPIYVQRSRILEVVNSHPVVLIRGNTGCGKTTQVCQ